MNFPYYYLIEAGVSSSRWAGNFSFLVHAAKYDSDRFDFLSC